MTFDTASMRYYILAASNAITTYAPDFRNLYRNRVFFWFKDRRIYTTIHPSNINQQNGPFKLTPLHSYYLLWTRHKPRQPYVLRYFTELSTFYRSIWKDLSKMIDNIYEHQLQETLASKGLTDFKIIHLKDARIH